MTIMIHSCNLLKPLRDQCINCSMSSFVMLTITFFSEHFVFLFKNIDISCFDCAYISLLWMQQNNVFPYPFPVFRAGYKQNYSEDLRQCICNKSKLYLGHIFLLNLHVGDQGFNWESTYIWTHWPHQDFELFSFLAQPNNVKFITE